MSRKLICVLGVITAVVFTGNAMAHLPKHNSTKKDPRATEQRQIASLAHHKGVVAHWLKIRNTTPQPLRTESAFPKVRWCGKLDMRAPAVVCWHAKARIWTQRELDETRLKIQRIEFKTLPDTNDWRTATLYANRVFGPVSDWLLSCSAAESRHGKWVIYGGGDYYRGYEYTDAVGGYMQFRPSTFRGAYRHAYDYARERGFIIPLSPRDWINSNGTVQHAWFRPLGQALAAGYLRAVDGSSGHHWSASVGNGC